MLYLAPKRNVTILRLRRKFRLPLHMIGHLLVALVFITCSQEVDAVLCSSIWPEACAIEALVLYLIWPACYPVLSAMSLSHALPLQLAVCAFYISHNERMCVTGFIACKNAPQHYLWLRNFLTKIASGLPLGYGSPSAYSANIYSDCSSVLAFFEVLILVVLSLYVTFAAEISRRIAYCRATNNNILQLELWRRRPQFWQMILEILLAAFVIWHLNMLIKFRL